METAGRPWSGPPQSGKSEPRGDLGREGGPVSPKRFCRVEREGGFSLIEATVAAGLLAASLVAVAQLLSIAVRGNLESRRSTYATVLAQQKLEQLQALTWGFDVQGIPISDRTTDTAATPERPTGGTGLSRSPSTSLRENTPGFVDYIDQFGRTLGGGNQPPPGTVYARRWSIQPLPGNPENGLTIQVLVTRSLSPAAGHNRDQDPGVAQFPDARVTTVRSRQAW